MNIAVANKQPKSTTLLIGNLADETEEADIKTLFAQYGIVSAVRLIPGAPNRRHDVRCYLEVGSRRAEAAISGLDGKAFRGSILHVKEALPHQMEAAMRTGSSGTSPQPANDQPPRTALRCHYQVATVEKVTAPDGAEGGDWYRYVLSSGNSRITGFHRGSVAEVEEYATECAEEFNLRGIRGKSARTMAPRKKK